MKKFAFILAISPLLTNVFADETTTIQPPTEILVPEGMENTPPPAQETEFVKLAKQYKSRLQDIEYSARRHNWHFGYNEIETMKAIGHLMRLADQIIQYGEGSPQGREAFYQMKQPLTYVSQFLPYNPLFTHVVHTWDTSLQTYQQMVRKFTGTEVQPSPVIDFNNPLFKQLQREIGELKDLTEQFSYQLKNGLPMVNAEAQGLIAYVDHFKAVVGKLNSASYSVVTQRHEMDQHLREAIKVSKQVTALVLYNPNEYIKNSWTVIRGKANQFRTTFEQLTK